jgi:hypothetical protein
VFRARRIARRNASAVRRADTSAPERAPEASDEAPPPDPAEQLADLGELREQGILTAEEFAAEKKRLFGA